MILLFNLGSTLDIYLLKYIVHISYSGYKYVVYLYETLKVKTI